MLKKIDQGKLFLQQNSQLFRCPFCHGAMQTTASGIQCENGHGFDVSKKGTLYFLKNQIKTEYDQAMFTSRQKLIKAGMYQPLLDKLATQLGPKETILDVGCGEGSFLNALLEKQPARAVGFDISKEGIYLASSQSQPAFWCVADLTNLPFANEKFSTILNIFSPSNYHEFDRVMASSGKLLKVIPGPQYLQELRAAFYPDDEQKQTYTNEPVLAKFKQFYSKVTQFDLTYTFDIPTELRLDLLEMSPLEWGVDPAVKAQLKSDPLKEITIDLVLMIGNKE